MILSPSSLVSLNFEGLGGGVAVIEEVFEEKVVEGSDEELLSDFFREMVDFPLLGT